MVERASDPRREWNVHLIIVIIIIRARCNVMARAAALTDAVKQDAVIVA